MTMSEASIGSSDAPQSSVQNINPDNKTLQMADSSSQMTGGNSEEMQDFGEISKCQETIAQSEALNKGFKEFGCSHYQRRCRIKAPCCNEIFDCHHCHNEAKNGMNVDPKLIHDIPRHKVEQVICSLCGTEQEAHQICVNCGVCMGRYYCGTCKLFDDDTSKRQYHCSGCGICRIGGSENFFHCDKCRCCYAIALKDNHPCIEGAMHHDCPICFEYLFESRNNITSLPCGHTIHFDCLCIMWEHSQYFCPLCSKSVSDMSRAWGRDDLMVAISPECPQDNMVCILCNDCGATSNVRLNLVAQKCPHCRSYNTHRTRD